MTPAPASSHGLSPGRPPRTLAVPRRFRGPATSGNGGWTSGALATLLGPSGAAPHPTFRVRLSAPPPLETPMEVSEGRAVLDGRVVLEATQLGDVEAHQVLIPVPPVSFEAAVDAGERYAGLARHPFPECFSCGPARSPGDGLRLRPGPLRRAGDAEGRVAAAWVPDESVLDGMGLVHVPVLWAALDCPGGWSVDIVGRPMVLGTMTARVLARPGLAARLVVTGRAVTVSDRKAVTATSLYSDGELIAVAAHVWVAVDPAVFGKPDPS
jgi:acyl-coenzyme A thioesterase PaaI-like protein